MVKKNPEFGLLQDFVESLYLHDELVSRLDIILAAESFGLNEDLQEIVSLLPPGSYTRVRLCGQINSSLSSHGWGYTYGTVA